MPTNNLNNPNLQAVIAALNAKKDGDGWIARCVLPENHSHGDANPSLVISQGNNGKPVVHCRSGCDQEQVWAAVCAKVAGTAVEPRPKKTFVANQALVSSLHARLATSPEVRAWLNACGISSAVADRLQLGASECEFNKVGHSVAVVTPHYDHTGTMLIGLKARALPVKDFTQEDGSSTDGLFAAAHLNPLVEEVLVLEGDKDVAIAMSHGFNAVGILSTQSRLSKADIALLSQYKRVYLIGDQDLHGVEAMDKLALRLPKEKAIRVRLQVKDIGALYEKHPLDFGYQLGLILRDACITRKHFDWDDLLTEDEIIKNQGAKLDYAIDQLIPARRATLLFGQEKSGKSLVALYAGKCVANGVRFLDKYATQRMPVFYLDAEHSVTGQYLAWLQNIGEEPIRFRTLETGIPALDDPSLLKICQEMKPLLVIDSLHKFNAEGGSSWSSSVMEPIMAKILRLTSLGATVIIVHHAGRAEADRYANSFAIGAAVDFIIAVVSSPVEADGTHRITLMGKPSRGAQPPTVKVIAFPPLKTHGKMLLDGNPVKTDQELVYDFIGEHPNSTTRQILDGVPVKASWVLDILKAGVKDGDLVVTEGPHGAKHYNLKTSVSRGGKCSNDDSLFPEGEMVGKSSDLIGAKC